MTSVHGPIPSFSRFYESAQQLVTAAGALTLAHGLGVEPKLVQAHLVCVIADLGCAVGDKLLFDLGMSDSAVRTNEGMALRIDATNIRVKFGSDGFVFSGIRIGDGATIPATPANWRLVVRAWA